MPEFTYNPIQIVQPGENVILNTTIGCSKGYVLHRNESGIVTLRGIVNNPCGCFARYQVTFNGNIALPEGAPDVAPIAIALALDGEPLQTSRAIVTPTEEDAYFNVTSTAIITVPRGCCFQVAVENVSAITESGLAPAINVQNANLTVARIA